MTSQAACKLALVFVLVWMKYKTRKNACLNTMSDIITISLSFLFRGDTKRSSRNVSLRRFLSLVDLYPAASTPSTFLAILENICVREVSLRSPFLAQSAFQWVHKAHWMKHCRDTYQLSLQADFILRVSQTPGNTVYDIELQYYVSMNLFQYPSMFSIFCSS